MAELPAKNGTLALVGAGEFLESMAPVDAELLRRAGGRKVAILPTASAPDGPGVPERWAAQGVDHFRALGAEAEAVMALARDDCLTPQNVEAVRRANLVYFSGGKPGYLLRTLRGTPLWQAVLEVWTSGGVLAGCSAGAMILGGWVPARLSLRHPPFWEPAFGLIPRSLVLPHFDEFPAWVPAVIFALRPRRAFMVGIDAHTALVGDGESCKVLGIGSVTVRESETRIRYSPNDTVELPGRTDIRRTMGRQR